MYLATCFRFVTSNASARNIVAHTVSLTENLFPALPKLRRTTSVTSMRTITYLPRLLGLLTRKRRMLLVRERRSRRGCHRRPALEILLLLLKVRWLSQKRAARTDRWRGRRDGAPRCDRRGWLGWWTWRGTALVRAEITVSTGLTGGKQIILFRLERTRINLGGLFSVRRGIFTLFYTICVRQYISEET